MVDADTARKEILPRGKNFTYWNSKLTELLKAWPRTQEDFEVRKQVCVDELPFIRRALEQSAGVGARQQRGGTPKKFARKFIAPALRKSPNPFRDSAIPFRKGRFSLRDRPFPLRDRPFLLNSPWDGCLAVLPYRATSM